MSEEFLFSTETFFMALADKTRLRLLNLMRGAEVCVCFFTEVLRESQPKISRHLAYLRNAGLVEARRDGKWMHYRIVKPQDAHAAEVLQKTLLWLSLQPQMRRDFEILSEVCSASANFANDVVVPTSNVFVETNTLAERKEIETYLL